MGRKLMRVPLDFRWPLRKVWHGYLNPWSGFSIKCTACDGSGDSPAARRYGDEWYGKADFDPVAYGAKPLTIDDSAVVEFARRHVEHSPEYYGTGESAVERETLRLWYLWRYQWCRHLIQADVDALVADGRLKELGANPTAEQVNAWSILSMGHDSINSWVCVRARCARNGEPTECAECRGAGDFWPAPELEKAHEDWANIDPPTGPGFQLWETTTEGSPVSPVFATLEELCDWCAAGATTFGDCKATAAEWRRMLDADFVYHKQGNAIFL